MSYCLVACHKLYCVVSEIRLGPSQKQDFTSQQIEWCPNENWKITKPSEKIYQTFGPVSFKSYQTDRILTRHCLLHWHKVALCHLLLLMVKFSIQRVLMKSLVTGRVRLLTVSSYFHEQQNTQSRCAALSGGDNHC